MNDFNNHAYNRFVEKIKVSVPGEALIWEPHLTVVKDAVDPNGILSPGKQGIWPERFRHLRETQHEEV